MRITIRAYLRNVTRILFASFVVRAFAHVPVRVVTRESCSGLPVRGIVLCIPWPNFQHYLLNLKIWKLKHYDVGTMVGYFRGWLAKLNKKRIKTPVLEAQNTLVPDVLKKLETMACIFATRREESISKIKKPIRSLLHNSIVTHSLKENTSSGYRIREFLNLLRSSIGRSGEVSTENC